MKLKPKTNAYDILEGDGFLLRIYPSGKKVFQFRYSSGGKRRRVTIGEYPTVFTLAEAREKHRELYRAYKRGEDPAKVDLEFTPFLVRDLARRYLAEHSKPNNSERGYLDNVRMLDTDVLPIIGEMEAHMVKRANVQECLQRCRESKLASAHNHTLTVIKKMFNFGIEFCELENNPAYLIKQMQTQPGRRMLTDDEIRAVWNGGESDSNKILQLQILTGQRPGECQLIEYSDIEDGQWWTCEQRKGGEVSYKRIYLPFVARKLIGKGKGRVFPAQNQQNGLAKYVLRKYKTGWTPKDIRRTVSTRIAKLGYSEEQIRRLRGHSEGILATTYNLHEYDDEKREMLLAWWKVLRSILAH